MTPPLGDPFDLLGVEPRFDLEKAELEARQRELSKVSHPDRFATTGAAERRAALNKAMAVNEAVRQLKNPVTRGHALLTRLLGSGASHEIQDVRVSPSLLMEVMQWREELSAAFTRLDKNEVARIAAEAEQRRRTTLSELTRGFSALAGTAVGGAAPDGQLVATIARELATLKYFERLAEEVRRMQDELADV